MNSSKKLEQTIIKKLESFSPISIFIYGSRARGDYTKDSDYDIGVVFETDNYISRKILNEAVNIDKVRIYPFKLEELKQYIIDTPFPKRVYIRELIKTSKVIYGKNVFNKIKIPKITLVDLISLVSFSLGRVVDGLIAFRSDDMKLAKELFVKSIFYGFVSKIMLEIKEDVYNYHKIYEMGRVILDKEGFEVLEHAYNIRYHREELILDYIFKGITCLNKNILDELYNILEEEGNIVVLNDF